jgi:uroporphyrinogen-III synthase
VTYLYQSLVNKILAITRNDADSEEFSHLVKMEGGKTIALPTIEIVPRDPKVILEFINEINEEEHDYCAFMSQWAVNVLFDLANTMKKTDQIISLLNNRTIIAVGPKTRECLVNRGINVHLMPEKYSAKGMVELFTKMNLIPQRRIIIPRSSASNDFIARDLGKIGIKVDELFLYDVRTANINVIWKDFILLLEKKRIDAIIFTSSSTALSFFEIMESISFSDVRSLIREVKAVIAIGPFTQEELRKKGIHSIESKIHTIRGTFELAKHILNEG